MLGILADILKLMHSLNNSLCSHIGEQKEGSLARQSPQLLCITVLKQVMETLPNCPDLSFN
jgi:hypothetical protein